MLFRLLAGVADDLSWRVEQATIDDAPARRTVTLTARAVGAALFLALSWVINIDATRRPSGSAFTVAPSKDVLQTDRLPLLTAGIVATVGPSMLPQLAAQSGDLAKSGPTFEVASVKVNESGDLRTTIVFKPGGRFTATNASLGALIRNGYQRSNFQIAGTVSKPSVVAAVDSNNLVVLQQPLGALTANIGYDGDTVSLRQVALARDEGTINGDGSYNTRSQAITEESLSARGSGKPRWRSCNASELLPSACAKKSGPVHLPALYALIALAIASASFCR